MTTANATTNEALRAAYAASVVAHEKAASAAYRAEKTGRCVGPAKAREARAWAARCAAERAYRAAA